MASSRELRTRENVEKIVESCESVQHVYNSLKVDELKNYLRDRDLNLSGKKSDLSKKVFGAAKLGILKCATAKEDSKTKENEKKKRLSLEGGLIQLPSPRELKDGWQEGSLYLPDTIESDVEDYLKVHGPKSIVKGCSLLESQHVFKPSFNNISPNVKYCFVRGKCIPQERTNNTPYEPWVCLKKDDGSVVTGECSCVAGLGEVCKHVGALLYFIASEVREGRNKSCTSKPQAWNKPSKGAIKKYTAKPMSAIRIQKAKARSVMLLNSRGAKHSRSGFDPRSLADREPMKLNQEDIQKLDIASNSNCCLLLHYDSPWPITTSPDLNFVAHEEIIIDSEEVIAFPKSIVALADEIKTKYSHLSVKEKCSVFLQELKLSEIQREEVANKTRGQSKNDAWSEMRTGMITASRMLAVVRKIDENGEIKNKVAADNLVSSILNYKPPVSTKATQWGILNEPVARLKYKTLMAKQHNNFDIHETGLVLSTEYPYLGASPDAVVNCTCCGKGLAEFKCTWSHREKTVKEIAELPNTCLLVNEKGNVQLNKKHEYYYQLQMQMAMRGVDYDDFYYLTSVEYHYEKIYFDKPLWKESLPKLCSFFRCCILPELFTRRIQHKLIVEPIVTSIIQTVESVIMEAT